MDIYFQSSKKRLLAAVIILALMFALIIFSGFIEKSAKGEYQTEEFVATEILGSDNATAQDDELPAWFYDELFNPYEIGASEIRCEQGAHIVGFTAMGGLSQNNTADNETSGLLASIYNTNDAGKNKTTSSQANTPTASQVNNQIIEAMKSNGWILIDSGNDSCQSMRKTNGSKTWTYIACVQLEESVSVVMTID